MVRCFVGVWVVELGGMGTGSHMGGRVDFTLTLVLSHQGRGDSVGCVVLFILTFDSSPIKGEGYMVGVLLYAPPCGYCLKASMTVRPRRIHPVVSRLRGNDGVVELSCCHPHLSPLPSRERGIGGGCVVVYVWSWPSHGFVVPFR